MQTRVYWNPYTGTRTRINVNAPLYHVQVTEIYNIALYTNQRFTYLLMETVSDIYPAVAASTGLMP